MTVFRCEHFDPGQLLPVRRWPVVADVDGSLWRRSPQIRQRPRKNDAAVIDDHDILTKVLDQIELMAGEQHRRTLRRQFGQQLGHHTHRDRVEPGERLIEHEQFGLVDQRRDQLDTLLIAVRQAVDCVVDPSVEPEPQQPVVDNATNIVRCPSAQPPEIQQLVPHPHLRVQPPLLGHVPEPGPVVSPHRVASPTHRTGVQLDEPEYRPHRSGLTTAVGTEEAGEPTGAGRERAPVEGCDGPETLDRRIEFEHGHLHAQAWLISSPTARALRPDGWRVHTGAMLDASSSIGQQPVLIRVSTLDGAVVRAPGWNGLVQTLHAEQGTSLASGHPIVTVGGITRLGMRSQRPIAHPLQKGDSGQDVTDLQTFLVSLGHDVEVDGSYGSATRSAVADLQRDLGMSKPSGVFTPDLVVWLPDDSVEVDQILLTPGELAPSQGTPIIASPDIATSGDIGDLGGSPIEDSGDRYRLVVGGGLQLGIIDQVRLSGEQLNTLMEAYGKGSVTAERGETASTGAGNTNVGTVLVFSGELELVEPETLWTVPAGAVVGDRSDAARLCVFIQSPDGDYEPFQTAVESGGFGWVAINPAPPASAMILANPVDVLQDRSCE